jgi:hypothetical protein
MAQESRLSGGPAEDAAYRADLEARVKEGDGAAKAALDRQRQADMLGSVIRGWRRRPGGMPQRRPAKAPVEDINPSRIFALLEKRGAGAPRHHAWIGLIHRTDGGGTSALADRS